MIYEVNFSLVESTFTVYSGFPWIESRLEELANYVRDGLWSNFRQNTSLGALLLAIGAQDVGSPFGLLFVLDVGTPGNQPFAPLPNNVSAQVRFMTGSPLRTKMGRYNLVGIPNVLVTGDVPSIPMMNNYVGWWQTWAANLVILHQMQHRVVSYCVNGGWRDEAISTPVTHYATDYRLHNMRRRLRNRGAH